MTPYAQNKRMVFFYVAMGLLILLSLPVSVGVKAYVEPAEGKALAVLKIDGASLFKIECMPENGKLTLYANGNKIAFRKNSSDRKKRGMLKAIDLKKLVIRADLCVVDAKTSAMVAGAVNCASFFFDNSDLKTFVNDRNATSLYIELKIAIVPLKGVMLWIFNN